MNRALPLILILALAVAAGCGDDEGNGEDPLSEAEFAQRANEICADGNEAIQVEAEALFTRRRPTRAEMEAFATETLIPNVRDQIEELRALTPPDELADDVDGFLAAAATALEEIEANPGSLAASEEDPFAEANALAAELGLITCASG